MILLYYRRSIFQILEQIGPGKQENLNIKPDVIVEFDLLFSPPKLSELDKGIFSFRLLLPNYLINLGDKEEEIFNRIHKNTRYKINRAINRDELIYHERTNPADEEIEVFKEFFNPFAKERNIRPCDVNKLKAIRDKGALVLSSITGKNNELLCCHVYQKDDLQGYLIYSASKRYNHADSHYRNLIGRANRYLHWKDIQSFKEKGCKWYNFGGKVINENDIGGQNVNKFKQEFGTVSGFDSRIFYSKTVLGKFGLILLHLKWKKSAEYKFSRNFEGVKKHYYRSC